MDFFMIIRDDHGHFSNVAAYMYASSARDVITTLERNSAPGVFYHIAIYRIIP
jgi:hypothetical protein